MSLGKLIKILIFLACLAVLGFYFKDSISEFMSGYRHDKAPETIAAQLGVNTDQGLAGITGQTQIGALQKAKTKITAADLSTIKNGVELYRVDHNGALPQNLDDLAKSGALGNNSIPKDPWGNQYDSLNSNGKFYIISAGPDKVKGTADDQTIDILNSEN